MHYEYKEVYFDQYCKNCKHYGNEDINDPDEPCEECQDNPTNLNSHKPVRFEKKGER